MAHKNPQSLSLHQAIAYYGPLVDKVASKYGISGSALLAKLVQGESGGNPKAVSSAGAKGLTQFMPGVRKAFLDAYGVDAYRSPGEAVYAATLHLRGKLGHGIGLEGYNPGGGQQYVKYILGQKVGHITPDTHAMAADLPGAETSSLGTKGTITGTSQVTDTGAERRVALANFLLNKNPNNRLVSLGVVNPNEPTTRTVTTQSTVSPSGTSDQGRMAEGSGGRALSLSQLPKGTSHFEGKTVAAWIAPALAYARKHGWKGSVTSGFRSFADQTRIYNSGVRPAAKPGTSNHEGAEFPRGAVDVSDAAQLSAILQKSPYGKLLQWAGPKDPVHFSHPHDGSY